MQVRPLHRIRHLSQETGKYQVVRADQMYISADRNFLIRYVSSDSSVDETGWYVVLWSMIMDETLEDIFDSTGLLKIAFRRRIDAIEAIETVIAMVE